MKRTLKERRERLGLTQADLARQAKDRLPPRYVSISERGKAHKYVVDSVRRALVEQELLARSRRHEAARRKRIDGYWLSGIPGAAKLKEEMLSRAWRLLDEGATEEVDAILEWLPEAEADALLDEFFWPEDHEQETKDHPQASPPGEGAAIEPGGRPLAQQLRVAPKSG